MLRASGDAVAKKAAADEPAEEPQPPFTATNTQITFVGVMQMTSSARKMKAVNEALDYLERMSKALLQAVQAQNRAIFDYNNFCWWASLHNLNGEGDWYRDHIFATMADPEVKEQQIAPARKLVTIIDQMLDVLYTEAAKLAAEEQAGPLFMEVAHKVNVVGDVLQSILKQFKGSQE